MVNIKRHGNNKKIQASVINLEEAVHLYCLLLFASVFFFFFSLSLFLVGSGVGVGG